MTHFPVFIKALASFGFAYACLQAFNHWNQYSQFAVISTVFVHLPMATFATVCAWICLTTNPFFSFFSACFVWLNAVLI